MGNNQLQLCPKSSILNNMADQKFIPNKIKRKKRRLIYLGAALLTGSLVSYAWTQRINITNHYVQKEMERLDVKGSYEIGDFGFRSQTIKNIILGDPNRPDFTAKEVQLEWAIDFGGPKLRKIYAHDIFIRGKYENEKLSFGELDKFSASSSDEAFALPNIYAHITNGKMALSSPYGNVDAKFSGKGNVQQYFVGQISAHLPKGQVNGCTIGSLRLNSQIELQQSAPILNGPIKIASINCATQNILLSNIVLNGQTSLSNDFKSIKVDQKLALGTYKYGDFSGRNVDGRFDGNVSLNGGTSAGDGNIIINGGSFSGQGVQIAMLSANAAVKYSNNDNRWQLVSNGKMAGQNINYQNIAGIASPLQKMGKEGALPVSPLLEKLGGAIEKAGRNFQANSKFSMEIDGNNYQIYAEDFKLSSKSGATLYALHPFSIGAADGKDNISPIRARLYGGGLPEFRIAAQANGGNSWRITADMMPYQHGEASLSLDRISAKSINGKDWTFASQILLSGPLSSGYIKDLRTEIDGTYSQKYGLSALKSCRKIAFKSFIFDALSLNAAQFNICGQGKTPIYNNGNIALNMPALSLSGKMGDAPIKLQSGPVNYSAVSGFALNNIMASIGEDGAKSQINAASLTGQINIDGIYGRMENAAANIVNVPLDMQEIMADWQFKNNILSLNGQMLVKDQSNQARFKPLKATNINAELNDNIFYALMDINEPSTNIKIADVDLMHSLSNADGRALFSLNDIKFDDKFQPELLTDMVLGVVANVNGVVEGNGQINWNSDGVLSNGRFKTDNMSLAAAFGPVEALQGEVIFDDLLNLESRPGQILKLGSVNPGIEALNGLIKYQLKADQTVVIEGGSWPFAGGTLILEPTVWDLSAKRARHLNFTVRGVDAALFLQQFELSNLSATGKFNGNLPMVFDASGGRIVGGQLESDENGGTIAYLGALSYEDLSPYANYAFEMLKSLKYDNLTIGMNGDLAGEIITVVNFTGLKQGDGAKTNFITRQIAKIPIIFKMRIEAEFLQLFSSVRGFYDPEPLTAANMRAILEKQKELEEIEKAKEGEEKNEQSVQQNESGDGL
ncbi:hypothetical protein LPB140_06785 [Sphingorhabdus lutea]|uniref:Uncharacterized protein n=1 Tax=Sphingorhabdus lutea TaxID=1913578 RepID=A0A1L3JBL5_9SPHN|nr:YdbH domain-containing protein [Sphingorhabdus lutea]APG62537.1 hypothetical protein LPB140_06785 [Sphingorhabdus lutea]